MDETAPPQQSAFCDPYAVFGATLETPLAELRKRYYDLSLICHPDKGGRAEDMIALRNAYEVVRAGQQNWAISLDRMAGTDAAPPSFADVWGECFSGLAVTDPKGDASESSQFTEAEFMAAVEGNENFIACSMPSHPAPVETSDTRVDGGKVADETGGDIEATEETNLVEFSPLCMRDIWCSLEPGGDCFDFTVDAPLHMNDLDGAFSRKNDGYVYQDSRLFRTIDALLEEHDIIDHLQTATNVVSLDASK